MELFEKDSNIFQLLTEAVSEGIVVVNDKQVIVSTNSSANVMFGYEEKELQGQSLNVLIPQDYRSSHSNHFNKFTSHRETRKMGESRDIYGLKKDGTRFAVEAGLNPFAIYNSNYVMALVIDISDRKKQERQIKELNENLERKVRERTKQLNESIISLEQEIERRILAETKTREALKKEKELNELKTKFLSLVSHEFKTPLTGILTSATLIGKYKEKEQQEKRNKHLNTIKSKVKYLDNILNDFLSVERLESGQVNYNFKKTPLIKVLDNVTYEAEMMLKKGQKIVCTSKIDNVTVEFDEKVLELILFNLIHNAVKYSPENTHIDITVETFKNELKIHVTDYGIGIPAEEQKFIFNRYFRAKNALLNQGTGIGLNILKSHLENLGGSICFISEENKGSTFSISIPTQIT